MAQALEALVKNRLAVPEQNAQIEKILQGALKKFHRPRPLVPVFANFATQQKNYAEAEKLLPRSHWQGPNNGAALNNLAMLFVAQGTKLDEALRIDQQRHRVLGRSTSKLDTRAILYLAKNEPENALADMNVVLGDGDDPDLLFHLARIYYRMGQKSEAAEALARARKGRPERVRTGALRTSHL